MKIDEVIDANNKLRYMQLLKHVMNSNIVEFVDEMQFPFLVGKELYVGELEPQKGGRGHSTFKFQADVEESQTTGAITRAVYALHKGSNTGSANPNVYTVGRVPGNDITIVDYAISKRHANIHHDSGYYFVQDCGSTNGVSVGEVELKPRRKKVLSPGCTVSFGRFSFVFTYPVELYSGLMLQLEMGIPAHEHLVQLMARMSKNQLVHIGKAHDLRVAESMKRSDMLNRIVGSLDDDQLLRCLCKRPTL